MRDAEWDAAQLLLSSAAPGSVLTMRLGEVRVKAPQPKYDGDQFLYELAFDGVPAPGTFAVCAEGDDAPGIPPPVRIGDAAVGRVCDVAPVVGGAWAIRARLVLMKPRSGTAAPLACTFWDRGAQMTVKLWGTLATEFEARGEYMGAYEVRGCASELCLRPVSRAAAARRFWCPYEAHFDRDSALQEGTIEACADDSDVELPNWGMSFDDIPPTRRQPAVAAAAAAAGDAAAVADAVAPLPTPSEEQERIIGALLERTCVTVNAVAGSGKTTTILLLLREYNRRLAAAAADDGGGGKTLIICYNARLKEGTRLRVSALGPEGCAEVHSFHSLGVKYYSDACRVVTGLSSVARGECGCRRPLPEFAYVFVDEAQDTCVRAERCCV